MRFKTNKRHLGLKENGITLNFDLANSKYVLFSDMKKVHIKVKKMAPLYKTVTVMVIFCITIYFLLFKHVEIMLMLIVVIPLIIAILSIEYKSYVLEISLKNGEILKNDIPRKVRKKVIKSLHEIRKGIFHDQIGKDFSLISSKEIIPLYSEYMNVKIVNN